jgi:hypothetical protein
MTRAIHVFTGPTISPAAARRELDAIYRPPAAQGDVYRAALDGALAIGIIDGYFETVPAVWHKEILWTISRGIPVYGSASMGALRAAELHRYGMIGVGAIFEAYRDGILEDDDEVAVTLGSEDTGFRSLSEAMVNIRATLRAAQAAGVMTSPTRVALERLAKDLYYPERSYPALLAGANTLGIPGGELARFRDWLATGRLDQKRADALAMLRRLAAERDRRLHEPARAGFEFQHTVFWEAVTRTIYVARVRPAAGRPERSVTPMAGPRRRRVSARRRSSGRGRRARLPAPRQPR